MKKIIEQIYTVTRYVRVFGVKYGMIALIKITRTKRTGRIRLRNVKAPLKLRLNGTSDKTVFYQVFLNKEYEIKLATPPRYIIDAGANIGLTSVYFANKYPDATIISIEPDRENFEVLQTNAKAYPQIIALNTALWSKSCHVRVKDIGMGTTGFIVEPCSPEEPGSLKAVSLNDIMTQYHFPRIDLLKVDIEGSEKYLLSENYEYWLSRTETLVIELHDRFQEGCSAALLKTFARLNFTIEPKGENFILRKTG
jgi:FkbM family methyltransferase